MKSSVTAVLALGLIAASAQAQNAWRALPAEAPAPKDNPTTPAKVELGRLLFHDTRLSESGSVSCASCHDVAQGGADHRARSIGVHGQPTGRNAPTVLNVGLQSWLDWDGRAISLEEQAKQELLDPIDMGMKDLPYAVERIRQVAGYHPYFERAFGAGDMITGENLLRAIAAYERSLVRGDTPYDRYVNGDASALDAQQLRGMNEFRRLDCVRCHQGPTFNGAALMPGTPWAMSFPTHRRSPYVATYALTQDLGRYEWSGKEADRFQWRVPTLRNLAYTAPYLHNGSVDTLENAVRVLANTELDLVLTDAQVADLVAFLKSLSGPLPAEPKIELPK
jgi:cytochrome c peroxidase